MITNKQKVQHPEHNLFAKFKDSIGWVAGTITVLAIVYQAGKQVASFEYKSEINAINAKHFEEIVALKQEHIRELIKIEAEKQELKSELQILKKHREGGKK